MPETAPFIFALILLVLFGVFIINKITKSDGSEPRQTNTGHGPCVNCNHIGFNLFKVDEAEKKIAKGEDHLVERQCRRCGDVSFVRIDDAIFHRLVGLGTIADRP